MSILPNKQLLACVKETIEKEHGVVVSDIKLDGGLCYILVSLPEQAIEFPETLLDAYNILIPDSLRPDGVMFKMFLSEYLEKYGLLEQLAEHTKIAFFNDHQDACEDVQASIDYEYMEDHGVRPYVKLIVYLKPGKKLVFDSMLELVEICDNTLVLRISSEYAAEMYENCPS